MITAKQLQGYPMLLRQGPASNKSHNVHEVVEMVAFDHLHSFTIAHGSINILEEGNSTLVDCNTRAGLQFHIIDILTWRVAGRKRCEWLLLWYIVLVKTGLILVEKSYLFKTSGFHMIWQMFPQTNGNINGHILTCLHNFLFQCLLMHRLMSAKWFFCFFNVLSAA